MPPSRKGNIMSAEAAKIIKEAQERGNGNVLDIIEYNLGDLENLKYVCSMGGGYAISPEEFLTQASLASDEYEREDGLEEDGFKYGSIVPTDIVLIHENGNVNISTFESGCEQEWLTIPVYHNGDEVAEDAKDMSEQDRDDLEAEIEGSLDDVTGLGIWHENDYSDLREGPVLPSELLESIRETGHCNFVADFKDGSKIANIPDGDGGEDTHQLPNRPSSKAKPFQPFHPWGSEFVNCAGNPIG